jgi:hypothetical protein
MELTNVNSPTTKNEQLQWKENSRWSIDIGKKYFKVNKDIKYF